MKTLHQADGQAVGAKDARVNTNPVTPGEAKALWHMMEKPSSRKIADWFTHSGRPVSYETICQWRRAGWPGSSVADFMKGAAAVLANIIRVAPTLTGDLQSALAVVVELNAKTKGAQKSCTPPARVGNADLAEAAFRAAIVGATAVWERVREIVLEIPSLSAATDTDERLTLFAMDADRIADVMLAANAALEAAVEGFRQLAVLRARNEAAMPGRTGLKPSRH